MLRSFYAIAAFLPCRSLFLLALLLSVGSDRAYSQLQANFSMDQAGGCSPLTVRFTNTTSGASSSASYAWDFGNGNSSTLSNTSAVFTEEGSYTVILTIKDGNNRSTQSRVVTVYKKPVIDFTPSMTKGCLPLQVNFTAAMTAGDGHLTHYHWDFGDGSTGEVTNPVGTHTYTLEQLATVSLTARNNYGCHNTIVKTDLVRVLPSLTADFEGSQLILCNEGDAVAFTNKSKGPGTLGYAWDFGDGQSSTATDPTNAFARKGTYSVKLTTTSSEGCAATRTRTNYIYVANYTTDITISSPICKDAPVTFTANTFPTPSQLSWTIDGNLFSYSSSQVQTQFYNAGSHAIELTATYGTCQQRTTKNFTVEALPVLSDFQIDLKDLCGAPALVNFKDNSTDLVQWQWDFNYNNYQPSIDATTQATSYTYTSNQSYYVWLKGINAAGCSRTVTKQVYIGKPFVGVMLAGPVDYEYITSCEAVTRTFKARSTETITSYKWLFDNGVGTSTQAEPTYTFSTPGSHTVQLEYETVNGCRGTANYEYSIVLYTPPKADFSVAGGTTICGNTFTTLQSLTQGSRTEEWWYMNGNYAGSSTGSILRYQFNEKGRYTVMLIADNHGCRDTMIKTDYLEVLPPFPQISGIANSCAEREKLTFAQESRYGEKWVWSFGDGQSATVNGDQAGTTHSYAATGSYKVVLSVTNGSCTVRDSGTAYVLLKPKPVLTGPTTAICTGQPVPYTISNLTDNPYPYYAGLPVDYTFDHWEYENGTPFYGYVGPYAYTSYEPYSSSLQNYDASHSSIRLILREYGLGCLDTTNYMTVLWKGAQPAFQLVNNDVCYNSPLQVKDRSVITGGQITKWVWDFGDGQSAISTQSETVSHQYRAPGMYAVTLGITDDLGCVTNTSSTTHYAQVNGPQASFYSSATVAPVESTVYFYNNSNDYRYYRAVYTWDYGNGLGSTGYSGQQVYYQPGKYTVTLTATDPVTGCSSTYVQQITIEPVKAAFSTTRSFIGTQQCLPLLATFNAISVNATSFLWDFGDGVTAKDARNPSHIYEKPGRYIVVLNATGWNGLPLQFIDSVIIPEVKASFTVSRQEACAGDSIQWQVSGAGVSSYVWDYGDGYTGETGAASSQHRYMEPGSYTPTLLLKDSNGCMSSAGVKIPLTIHALPTVKVAPAAPEVCLGASQLLTATGGSTYQWAPALYLDNAHTDKPTVTPVETISYQVAVTDAQGCKNEGKVTVTVHHPITIALIDSVTLCAGDSTLLRVTGATRYNWIDETAGLSSTTAANNLAHPDKHTLYTVVGYDAYNCFTDTASVYVTVHPVPQPYAGRDVEIEAGKKVPLQASTLNHEEVSWVWTPAEYLSCSRCAAPVSTPIANITYTATARNEYGCEASDEVYIKMLCDENRVAIPNAFTPNGDGKNDVFLIKGISFVKHLIIYNRWGNKVFERNNFIAADPANSWNGSLRGEPQPTGTYVYFTEMQCEGGGVFTRKGTVMLIR